MDLGRSLRDLLGTGPQSQPAHPYRRAGGILLVPAAGTFVNGPVLTNFDVRLAPAPSESPRLPFESWSISSFAIPYDLAVEQGAGPDEVATPDVSVTLYMTVNYVQVWSQMISQTMVVGPATNRGEIKGTAYSNLAQPLTVAAGAQVGFGVMGAFPFLREPVLAGQNCNLWFSLQPLQISYTAEGG